MGLGQAISYLDDMELVFKMLSETPLISRERVEFSPAVRIHHHAHHLVVYVLTEFDEVLIVCVLHESMDIDAQMKSGSYMLTNHRETECLA